MTTKMTGHCHLIPAQIPHLSVSAYRFKSLEINVV